jgi:hypothetical protein
VDLALLAETAQTTPVGGTPSFGLLVVHILSRAPVVVRLDVHRPKPRQLVLVATDIHGSRRPFFARPGALHGA